MDFIRSRMDLGRERYGHGVQVRDDTRSYGTKEDSWEEMADEEFADGVIYLCASYIKKFETPATEGDDNDRILELVRDPSLIKCDRHRGKVQALLAASTRECQRT